MGGAISSSTYNTAKRFIDLLIVLLTFIPVIILIVIFSLIIVIDIRTFPVFIQKRGITTRNLFPIIKLRTLRRTIITADVDIFCKKELQPYTTPFCSWLRRTGLDELPQFINVLLGHMSLVGPRPFSLNDIHRMHRTMPDYYKRRARIYSKPGLTGLWQIYGNREFGAENLLELEEEYESAKSFFLDLKIILNTIPVLLSGRNGRVSEGEKYECMNV